MITTRSTRPGRTGRHRLRGRVAASILAVGAATTLVSAGQQASAIDQSKGYAGACTGSDARTGTTMVVDFQELNGNAGLSAPTITRCSPNTTGAQRTGVQALQDAGIAIAGTAQYGLGFICRIEGRPTATETQPDGHKESCNRTPPASGYWGYWHADGTGSTWTYSSYGAANRKVVPGGFDGWSFSANKTSSSNPPPRVTPLNPASDPGATRAALQVDDVDRTITLGTSTTLTWSTTNATSVKTAGTSPGTGGGTTWGSTTSLATNGTRTITPNAVGTYTYTLSATGPKGTTTTSATLTVTS